MTHARLRRFAAATSLVVAFALLAVKTVAWLLTGSAAVLSDAAETLVNVATAAFALYSVRLADAPPDDDHPYGHGKIEDLAGALEGALISMAGVLIAYEGVRQLIIGGTPERLTVGLALTGAAGAANLALGVWLLNVSRRTASRALEAEARHVLSDVYTTLATLGGLALVRMTGDGFWDPLAALLAAANLLRMGYRLLREAAARLMDKADQGDLSLINTALAALDEPLLVGWADVRSRHQGRHHHVDLTIFVPGASSVEQSHALADRVEHAVTAALGDAAVLCHVEPEHCPRHVRSSANGRVSPGT